MIELASATDGRGGGSGRILIVEDEIPFLRMLHTNLHKRGYDV
jgi:ActR/RegA family two-component response regulator